MKEIAFTKQSAEKSLCKKIEEKENYVFADRKQTNKQIAFQVFVPIDPSFIFVLFIDAF